MNSPLNSPPTLVALAERMDFPETPLPKVAVAHLLTVAAAAVTLGGEGLHALSEQGPTHRLLAVSALYLAQALTDNPAWKPHLAAVYQCMGNVTALMDLLGPEGALAAFEAASAARQEVA